MHEYTFTPAPRDPNEEDLKVGPVEAESAAQVLARLEREWAPEQVDEEPMEPPVENPTFTLKELLIVITALSVWLGILRALSALKLTVFSGLLGLAALGAMFWLSTRDDQPKIVRVIWWGMLIVYVTCSAATLLAG
jgi:hypothetical protein